MWQANIVIENVSDPVEIDGHKQGWEHFDRNCRWLEQNWKNLLPRARGMIVAVAGEEAFLAETPEEAWKWTKEHHPEDMGPLVQYVFAKEGPRCYGIRGRVADVR